MKRAFYLRVWSLSSRGCLLFTGNCPGPYHLLGQKRKSRHIVVLRTVYVAPNPKKVAPTASRPFSPEASRIICEETMWCRWQSWIGLLSPTMSSWLCNIEALSNVGNLTSVTCLGHPLTVKASSAYSDNLDPCVCLLNLVILGLPLLPLLTPRFNLPQPAIPVPPPPPIPTPPNTLPPLPDIPDIPEALPNGNTPEELAEIFPDVAGDAATCNTFLIKD